jgi:hypothetical protein
LAALKPDFFFIAFKNSSFILDGSGLAIFYGIIAIACCVGLIIFLSKLSSFSNFVSATLEGLFSSFLF